MTDDEYVASCRKWEAWHKDGVRPDEQDIPLIEEAMRRRWTEGLRSLEPTRTNNDCMTAPNKNTAYSQRDADEWYAGRVNGNQWFNPTDYPKKGLG